MSQVNTDTTAALLMLNTAPALPNNSAVPAPEAGFDEHLHQAQQTAEPRRSDRSTDDEKPEAPAPRPDAPPEAKAAAGAPSDDDRDDAQPVGEAEDQQEAAAEETSSDGQAAEAPDTNESQAEDESEKDAANSAAPIALPNGLPQMRQLHEGEETGKNKQDDSAEPVKKAEGSAPKQESDNPANAKPAQSAAKQQAAQAIEQATAGQAADSPAENDGQNAEATDTKTSKKDTKAGGKSSPEAGAVDKQAAATSEPKQQATGQPTASPQTVSGLKEGAEPAAADRPKKSEQKSDPVPRVEPRTSAAGGANVGEVQGPQAPAAAAAAAAAAVEVISNANGQAKAEQAKNTEATSPIDGAKAEAGAAATRTGGVESPAAASAARSAQPGAGVGETQRMRLVQRVSRAFQAMGSESGTIRLRLSPPELGSLRLEVSVRHGVMSARLEVETQAARHALLDNLPALRERLAQQDIRVERFDVDLSKDSSGGMPRQPGDQPHSGHPSGRQAPQNSTPQGMATTETAEPTRIAPGGESSQLNLII